MPSATTTTSDGPGDHSSAAEAESVGEPRDGAVAQDIRPRQLWLPWRPRFRLILAYPRGWHYVPGRLGRFDGWVTRRFAGRVRPVALLVFFPPYLGGRFRGLVAAHEVTVIAFAATIYLVWAEWLLLLMLWPIVLGARLAHRLPSPLIARAANGRWTTRVTGWRPSRQATSGAVKALTAGAELAVPPWQRPTEPRGSGWFGILAAVLAASLLTACGSTSKTSNAGAAASVPVAPTTAPSASGPSTSTTSGGGKFNSCSVVNQAEAASAIGQAVTPGVLGNATVEGGVACVFYGPSAPNPRNPNAAQPDSVRVVVVKGSDALVWYRDYRSKVNARSISGYGDQAFYDGYASLSVLKGDSYLRIAVSPAGAPPSLSDEKKLAATILPKL